MAGRREKGSLAAALVVLVIVVFVVLYVAVLSPKPPRVEAIPVALRRLQLTGAPHPGLSLTLFLGVHVQNPNYAGVDYRATTAAVYYRDRLVGWAPVPAGHVGARSDEDIGTVVDIFVDRLASGGALDRDIAAGSLTLTSFAAVRGKGTVARIIKLEVLTHTTCETTVLLGEAAVTSSCSSTVEISP